MRTVSLERQQLKEQAQRLARRGRSGSEIARRLEIPERTACRFMNGHNPASNVADKMAVHYASASDEWATPQRIIALVMEVLGTIDLDPCADEARTIPARAHFTREKDGLSRDWFGRVFMNPPYGQDIGQWVSRLLREYESGRTTDAIALVPSRTGTRWFTQFDGYAKCFIRGRLRFGSSKSSAPFPSVVVYLGSDLERFAAVFGDLGHVERP